jgi:hypothetical protein
MDLRVLHTIPIDGIFSNEARQSPVNFRRGQTCWHLVEMDGITNNGLTKRSDLADIAHITRARLAQYKVQRRPWAGISRFLAISFITVFITNKLLGQSISVCKARLMRHALENAARPTGFPL